MLFSEIEDCHLGVPMGDIEKSLITWNFKVERDGQVLVVPHGDGVYSRVEVVAPAAADDGVLHAVVTVRTSLPPEYVEFLKRPGSLSTANRFASLGSIVEMDGTYCIGARVSFYRTYETWSLHVPMIVGAVLSNAAAILDPWYGHPTTMKGTSLWTEEDMNYVRSHMRDRCYCNAGRNGFTAEFGLSPGATTALLGHLDTALWQNHTDQPHPALGGGLFCLLQLPQCFDDDQLERAIAELNRMEMEPHDFPPHFGAWCRGRQGNSIAYVSFLPNALHSVYGIAGNMAVWAAHRTHMATAMLKLIAS